MAAGAPVTTGHFTMAKCATYDYSGKHAIVTGGAWASARPLSRVCWAGVPGVSIWDRDIAALASAQSRLGTQVQTVEVDVSDEQSVASAVKASHAWGARIDILVNSAGITGPNVPVIDYAVDDWDRVFAINTRGTFLTCKHVAAVMVQALGGEGYGRIVNIASVAGKEGAQRVGLQRSKAAVTPC